MELSSKNIYRKILNDSNKISQTSFLFVIIFICNLSTPFDVMEVNRLSVINKNRSCGHLQEITDKIPVLYCYWLKSIPSKSPMVRFTIYSTWILSLINIRVNIKSRITWRSPNMFSNNTVIYSCVNPPDLIFINLLENSIRTVINKFKNRLTDRRKY